MDIHSGYPYPSGELSNFAAHDFIFKGVKCASMEGLLQSFTFADPTDQIKVCSLIGYTAKQAGELNNWRQSQTLYWNGKPIKRGSQEYQDLLDDAYEALFQNEDFRNALAATKHEKLTHSIGCSDSYNTILTTHEFCSRLMNLRDKLYNETTDELF